MMHQSDARSWGELILHTHSAFLLFSKDSFLYAWSSTIPFQFKADFTLLSDDSIARKKVTSLDTSASCQLFSSIMARYVPPALRSKDVRSETPAGPGAAGLKQPQRGSVHTIKMNDVLDHYWPDDNSSSGPRPMRTTLHSSLARPDELVFVVLYTRQNPRWKQDGIIFAKSNLKILPWAEREAEQIRLLNEKRGHEPATIPSASRKTSDKSDKHLKSD
jgi:hypothetical protein